MHFARFKLANTLDLERSFYPPKVDAELNSEVTGKVESLVGTNLGLSSLTIMAIFMPLAFDPQVHRL